MLVFDCKSVADSILESVTKKVSLMAQKPDLRSVRLEGNQTSKAYANGIRHDCQRCGIQYFERVMCEDNSLEDWSRFIVASNNDDLVDGILVFEPAPNFNEPIIATKDVDARSTRILHNPCTPDAVIRLLEHYGVPIEGAHAVVIGRSNVGRPMVHTLLLNNATVTVCHSKTHDLARYCRQADILVSTTGSKGVVTGSMVKPGAAVVDIGGGDVDFESVSKVAKYVTPPTQGIGLITRAILMEHMVTARGYQEAIQRTT